MFCSFSTRACAHPFLSICLVVIFFSASNVFAQTPTPAPTPDVKPTKPSNTATATGARPWVAGCSGNVSGLSAANKAKATSACSGISSTWDDYCKATHSGFPNIEGKCTADDDDKYNCTATKGEFTVDCSCGCYDPETIFTGIPTGDPVSEFSVVSN